MGNFQKGGSRGGFRGGDRGGDRGGRGGFQKKSWGGDRGGDRDRGPVTMHRAVCGDCGNNCEVPFRPNGDRPVLCNDCFGGKRDGDRGGRSDFGNREPRREFSDRSSSFSKPAQGSDDILKKQLSEMNTKLDKLVNLLEKFTKAKAEVTIPQGDPVIVVKEESKKTPSLKTLIKKVVKEKVSVKKAPVKKVAKK